MPKEPKVKAVKMPKEPKVKAVKPPKESAEGWNHFVYTKVITRPMIKKEENEYIIRP